VRKPGTFLSVLGLGQGNYNDSLILAFAQPASHNRNNSPTGFEQLNMTTNSLSPDNFSLFACKPLPARIAPDHRNHRGDHGRIVAAAINKIVRLGSFHQRSVNVTGYTRSGNPLTALNFTYFTRQCQ
jgi:hypothetical protein